MPDLRTITVTVNGTNHTREVETRMHLGDFVRREVGLTGTHLGCEHGVCGACTLQVDGLPVRSCLMLAVQADGREVVTIEALAQSEDRLHPIQSAFRDHHALQCGFCTPGMIMSIEAYLRENCDPSEDEIRDLLSGNICRCTGYEAIVDAAFDSARRLRALRG